MTDREVMQQALEALEDERYVSQYTHIVDAIAALRTALEQPEQGPTYKVTVVDNQHPNGVPYEQWATPPAAQPEQGPVGEVLNERGEIDYISYVPPVGTSVYTAPPAAQPEHWDKPSASFNKWWNGDYMPPANPFDEDSTAYWAWAGWQAAQRPWQGLDDYKDWDEIDNKRGTTLDTFADGAAWAGAKLKERNA